MNFIFDESHRLRTFWRISLFSLTWIMVYMAMEVFLAILFVLLCFISRENPFAGITSQEQVYAILARSWFLDFSIYTKTFVSFLVCVVFRWFLDRRCVCTMGLVKTKPGVFSSSLSGFGMGIGLMLGVGAVATLAGGYFFDGFAVSLISVVNMLLLFTVAAFNEEIVFRGYLLQNFLDSRRPTSGVIITSIMFCFLHGANPSFWSSPIVIVNLFLAGVVLALAYIVSENIWFPTALHMGWNYAQGVILGIPVSGIPFKGIMKFSLDPAAADYISGGLFGLEGSLVATAGEICLIVLFLCRLQLGRRGKEQENEGSFEPQVVEMA